MSDADLLRCERDLSEAPADLDLRRRHARLLQRMADEERSLSALDLAWRLGADEVWDELAARLEARAIQVDELALRYVPAGPFVMGLEGFDDDASPPHLVYLSGFYMTRDVITYATVHHWEGLDPWLRERDLRGNEYWSKLPFSTTWDTARKVGAHVTCTASPPDRVGACALPSEAEWERALRATLLRRDGENPYGIVAHERSPEWTNDLYDPAYYERSSRFDPPGPEVAEPATAEVVVRGAPSVAQPAFPIYREAASPSGEFRVQRKSRTRTVRHQHGIVLRLVFRCA